MIFQTVFSLAIGFAAAAAIPSEQSSKSQYGTMTFSTSGNITRATFYNPPINLVDSRVTTDLYNFLASLDPKTRSTPPPKVVIFDSALPGFFLNHLDVNQVLLPSTPAKQTYIQQYVNITELFQSLNSTVFIAEINGVGYGAGNEMPMQMDLRYAGPNAKIAAIENALGAIAGQGGQLFSGVLAGKGRALEHLLAVEAYDGPSGTADGVFNGYYTSADALRNATAAVAARIALLSYGSINATKSSLERGFNPSMANLNADVQSFNRLIVQPSVQASIRKYLTATKNQTDVAFELGGPDTYLNLNKA